MAIKGKVSDGVRPANAPEVQEQAGSPVLRTILLVLGDALVFLIFATIGRRSHGEIAGLAALGQTALTAAPFAIGWFLVAPFIGAYRRTVVAQPRKMFLRTLLAWLAGWPIGLLLRGIFVDHAVPPVTFALITLVSNAVLLSAWRGLFLLGRGLLTGSRK